MAVENSATSSGGPHAPSGVFAKWGPFIIVGSVGVLVAIAIGVAAFTGSGESTAQVAAPSSTTTSTIPTAPYDFPLSYPQAQEQGLVDTIEWGTRCDTKTGRLAVADFYSPLCMAPFIGDNGGATSTGVEKGAIKIVHYLGPEQDPITKYAFAALRNDDTNEQKSIAVADFIEYFEQYYEFYGRKVELVTYQSQGQANDEAAARADATRIAEEIRPFAVIGGPAFTTAFAEELATRKVICIECGAGSTQWFTERDPYVWTVDAGPEQKQAHVAELVQKQLANKPAAYAGEALKATPRVFGLIYLETGPESKVLADGLTASLEAAGAKPAQVSSYSIDPATIDAKATEIITAMKTAGVTTIILETDPAAPVSFTRAATALQYFPEWLVGGAPLTDLTLMGRSYDQTQWKQAFGVTTLELRVASEGGRFYDLYKWFTGREPFANQSLEFVMPGFALLFAGVQSAGPNLTPETFAAAVRALDTPRASSRQYVKWGATGDNAGVDDASLFWWDPANNGLDENLRPGPGVLQFVDGGKRYLLGEWPAESRLFLAEGAKAVMRTRPDGEEIPKYPSPAGGDAATESSTSSSGAPEESSTTTSSVPAQ